MVMTEFSFAEERTFCLPGSIKSFTAVQEVCCMVNSCEQSFADATERAFFEECVV